ncbi:hypothetical protein [uncultured Tateyamaria sp.]|uniref:hypothetical protein n=1 Tax=uncultured Tateyamaria sp. TaxID=455651 RepID=UPI002611EAEA|nr:hypothetical protein [uncultured Tateyamaria sp.]
MGLIQLLLRRDNIINLITALIAVGILITDWFFGDVDASVSFEVILFVLAAICVGNIVEREERFSSLEKKIEDQMHETKSLLKPTFVSRKVPPGFPELMKEHTELFYTGGHLYHFIHTHARSFDQWLKEGKSIRLILQNPENIGLSHMEMPCANYRPTSYKDQIRESLEILKGISACNPRARTH